MEKIREYTEVIFVESIKNLSDRIGKRIFISLKDNLLILTSPKHKKELIYLNLDRYKKDYWEYSVNDNKITIYPSIDFWGKYRNAHFFVIKNKVYFIE